MTVRETLRTAAYLRFPSSRYTRKQKEAHADAIIKKRKRAAIGQELVGSPEVLFLDEPTSGLDSNSAFAVIDNVRSEAVRTGRVVVLTIHQPSIEVLYLFSKVILFSAGATVLFGPLDDALAHFDRLGLPCPPKRNPADFFLDILTIDQENESDQTRIRDLHAAYRSLGQERRLEAGSERSLTPGDASFEAPEEENSEATLMSNDELFELQEEPETGILYRRAWTEILRNKPLLMAEFALMIVVVLVMGFAFFKLDNDTRGVQNRAGILFFWPINQ
ncbi:hypothetical protein BDK51DRAFT_28501, partial [Blyttiomyces helicus]